jgi:signal transduction histidine kinase
MIRFLRRLSLRKRLTLVLAAGAMVVLVAGLFLLYHSLSGEISDAITTELELRVSDVAELGGVSQSHHVLAQVVDENGDVVTPSGATPLLRAEEVAVARDEALLVDRAVPGVGANARLLAVPRNGRIVVAATTTRPLTRARARLALILGVAGPALVAVIALAGWFVIGAALRPVRRMTEEARAISQLAPGRRLPRPPGDDEIAALGRTLNRMLRRIEATVAHERAFIDDASHELRTPIATLRAELELALDDLDDRAAVRASLLSAIEDADRLTRLVESLLVLARADAGQLTDRTDPVELDACVRDVIRRTSAAEHGRTVEVRTEPVTVVGDPALLDLAVANVMANAWRHARERVLVEVTRDGDDAVITVADDGAGFAADVVDRAFDRFTRAAGARSRSDGGVGLGLAIVAAVTDAMGGRPTAGNGAPLGGANVTLRMPAAPRT